MKLVKVFAFLLIFLVGCKSSNSADKVDNNAVVQVGKNVLTKNELSNICRIAAESSDSTAFVQNYINKWIENELLYLQAEKEIKDNNDIEKLVDDYRKTLIINKFKQYIANTKTPEPSEEELRNFYEAQKQNYLVQSPLIKGALVKVSKKAPQISTLKTALKKLDAKAIEQIEKYSLKTPISYNFFPDKWLKFSDIQTILPSSANKNDGWASNRLYELQDSVNYYYLSITALLPVGSQMPFEMVKDEIAVVVKEKQELTTIKNYTCEIIEKAKKKGIIIIK